ncbi:MAG: C-GCAxxG-C-C family protein [Clostridia bacterium]|nr:C-GCAxxG-C-C family protein [Clostridia bacterium]
MLADVAEKYFLEGDYNCAESVLLAANEVYKLGLDGENAHRLVSAFGGGMGCGMLCGAIAGSMAALGQAAVTERAHVTEGFKDLCAETAEQMQTALGDMNCSVIKPALFQEGRRCAETVRRAADVLEKQLDQLMAVRA